MANIRLQGFPTKSLPIGADISYLGDSTNSFTENQSTFDNIISSAFQTAAGGANIATSGSSPINIGTGSYSGTMSIGNASSTATILGTVNIGTTGSQTITIGNGVSPSTTTIKGTITLGDGDPAANTTIGIADSGSISVLKTINIGNNNSTPSVSNILGIVTINNAGSNGINIGTGTYTGITALGNITSNVGSLTANMGGWTYDGQTPYSTGSVATSGASTTITGTGTTFTSAMTGGVLFVTSQTNMGTLVGVTFVNATTLTADQTVTIASGSSYKLYYGGIQYSPATYNIGSGTNVSTINIGKNAFVGTSNIGGNVINVNANSTGTINIGNALNSVNIGNQTSLNSIVNIQPNTGSGATNIGATAGYTGTITIGNASSTLVLNGTSLSAPKISLTNTTNQIAFGTTNITTFNVPAPASSQTVNLTDAAANSNVVQCNTTNTTILVGPPYKANTTLTIAGNGSGATASGAGTTIYGQGSGATLTTGTNCTIIGAGSDVSSSGAIERMAIGQGITVNNNHQCVIGSALLSVVPGNVGTTTLGQNASPWAALILGVSSSNNVLITPATQGAARALTIQDPGGAADILTSAYPGTNAVTWTTTAISFNTSGSSAMNIGTGSYSGTLSLGNTSAVVNLDGTIQAGTAGTTTIGTSAKPFAGIITGQAANASTEYSTVTVTMTQAQVDGMFATPFNIVPAPGAGKAIIVVKAIGNYIGGTNAFGGGGIGILQYGTTVHGAGFDALFTTGFFAAGFLTGGTTNQFVFGEGLTNATTAFTGQTSSTVINTGVYMSNQTAAFTNAGSGATLVITVSYMILSMS